MGRLRTGVTAVVFGVCSVALRGAPGRNDLGAQDDRRLALHVRRGAETDLEVRGLAEEGARFIPRSELLALPQVEAMVKRDENFSEMPAEGAKVRGVEFSVLLQALGIRPADAARIAVEAGCGDGYTPTFPADYMQQHHPILVLTVEESSPSEWAGKTHTGDMGPYFVAYSDFRPAFQVLSHEDRPQVPVQMVWLEIATQERMFAGIRPHGAAKLPETSPVMQGYRVAQQNCFRCHEAAGFGGTKAHRDWRYLGGVAKKRPEWFAKWVHDPQSIDPRAEMPPNLKYDRATLTALTKYFAAMG